MGNIVLQGATSGSTTLTPTDAVTVTLTLPTTSGTLALAGSGGLPGVLGQVFTSSGTFTIPTGVTALKVTVVGGGGGGNSSNGAKDGCNNPVQVYGTGGGSSGVAISYLTGLTSGNTLAVTIGGGGGNSANGGSSTVASGSQSISTITGGGGSHGNSSTNSVSGGSGGSASGGTINLTGQYGQGSLSTYYFSGTGGSNMFGMGGVTTSSTFNNFGGSSGTGYGAGGSGSANNTGGGSNSGGSGTSGIVIFEW
jgi:hypothetical protein